MASSEMQVMFFRNGAMNMAMFYSTRGAQAGVSAPEAVLRGIAPDGGLYVLKDAPQILPQDLRGMDFCALSARILSAWLPGYTEDEIAGCVSRAYRDKFDVPEIAPLKRVGDKYVLELFHGPTAAFKDVALSVLPQLMRCAMEKRGGNEKIMILTATSGDTGSAALTGFCDVPNIGILVFYPEVGISPIQRAQMTAAPGKNVCACAIQGNFDDAQTGVKRIFSEISPEFCGAHHLSLSSANSINIGRLAPQIVYYYSAYLALVEAGAIQMGETVDFSVPTGNFGDILAGHLARLSGLPVGRLVCASNANNVLTDFIHTGVYDRRREFLRTISPSMDILVSSNLERLLYLASGCDGEAVRSMMDSLRENGCYRAPEQVMSAIRAGFDCGCASDAEAMDTIGRVFRKTHYLMDPHTAVAWKVAEDAAALRGGSAPMVVLSTASPFKFPQSVLAALGEADGGDAQAQLRRLECVSDTEAPRALSNALTRPARFKDVVAPENMMAYVMERAAEV